MPDPMSFDTTVQSAQVQMDYLTSEGWRDMYNVLTADFTLTSQTAIQKLFNNTTNGALILPTGIYDFEAKLDITGMDATSGNGTFDILGAGTATLASILQQSMGLDATTQTTAAALSGALSLTSAVAFAVAATGTALGVTIKGGFNVTVAGTIIPSVGQTTAAAAVVKAGSMFTCKRLGDYRQTFGGAWI